MNPEHIHKLANEWRQDWGYVEKGGVVILFNNEVQGWSDELRDPNLWVPGCIACDSDGNQFLAVGGNNSDGAERWEALEA